MTISIGLVGARGHVGSELIRLIETHPEFELGFVSSRERAGQKVAAH
ncbi:MAG TPA: N-acetyl-gamma-glutamyl-phosphate reductase, partial [Arenimonas sp.]|nr:N-acetyl-gamma-glutamyl-phosphate reductase [Arenimonas sp.]